MDTTDNVVIAEVLSRLNSGELAKSIASVLSIQYGTVLRIEREALELLEDNKTKLSGISSDRMESITNISPHPTQSIDGDVGRHLDSTAIVVLNQITKLANYTPEITANELQSLATGVAKLKLAFMDSNNVEVSVGSSGLQTFMGVLKD